MLVYNKQDYINSTDTCYNQPKRRVAVYARNACYDLAKTIGKRFFFVVDDDLKFMQAKTIEGQSLRGKKVRKSIVFKILNAYKDWQEKSRFACVGFAGVGEFLGGIKSQIIKKGVARILQNFYCCDVEKRLEFKSVFCEDVTTAVLSCSRGKTVISPYVIMAAFDVGKGTSVADYNGQGYEYNFSCVMLAPASYKATYKKGCFGNKLKSNYFPMILSGRWKK